MMTRRRNTTGGEGYGNKLMDFQGRSSGEADSRERLGEVLSREEKMKRIKNHEKMGREYREAILGIVVIGLLALRKEVVLLRYKEEKAGGSRRRVQGREGDQSRTGSVG